MSDNVIQFPTDRKAKVKTKSERWQERFEEKKWKARKAEIKAMALANDNVLKKYQLGKYNPNKKQEIETHI